jgi:hypothetical protein
MSPGMRLRLDLPQPGVNRAPERLPGNGSLDQSEPLKRERTLEAPELGQQVSVRTMPCALLRGRARWLDPVRAARAGAVGDDGGHAGEAFAGFGDFVDAFAAGVPAGDHEGDGDEGDDEGQG